MMTKENAEAFYKELSENNEWGQKVTQMIKVYADGPEEKRDEAAKNIIALAHEKCITITKDDLSALSKKGTAVELDEDSLKDVVGGSIWGEILEKTEEIFDTIEDAFGYDIRERYENK